MASQAVTIRQVSSESKLLPALHTLTLPDDRKPRWSEGWWWIARRGDEPVGFAGLQPSTKWADAMYMVRAGVAPDARGQGLQRRLIRVRERFARSLGMRWLITTTYDNPPSANNLIDTGFHLYLPAEPWGSRGTLYWHKLLTGVE